MTANSRSLRKSYENATHEFSEGTGIKHFMEHLMDPLAGMIKTLGTPDITPDLKRTIAEGVLQEAGDRSVQQLAEEENGLLIGLLRLRAAASQSATGAKA